MKKAFICFLFLSVGIALCAQQKYALVIGNGNYTYFGSLPNAVNDANDMETALKSLGFTVDKVLDGSRAQMVDGMTRLKNRLSVSKNSYGFLFYAGHAIQFNGINYLIPSKADIPGANYLGDTSVSVQSMLAELNDAGNDLNIVVLDACRDFPAAWNRSTNRGLTVVTNQPADSIIVYATSAGSVASDGAGRNGLFTSHLLRNLKIPGLEIKEVFNRTGADVSQASGKKQMPAVYNQFFGSAYLAGGQSSPPPVSNQIVSVVPDLLISASFATGNIKLKSEIAGAVMINGFEIGNSIKAGRTVTIPNVSAGRTEVAIRSNDGIITKAPQAVTVQQGQTVNVSVMAPKKVKYTIPNWVQTMPYAPEDMAYFIGKSERMENYKNYLEAKAGALMDVLTQFSLYKGAEIQHSFNDYVRDNGNSPVSYFESIAKINVNNNSTGLYQRAEWMADDGTLYVFCVFAPNGRTYPEPDFPIFFRDYPLENNRTYFVAMAVSPYNTKELAIQAEQNAKMQALLWLGSNINGMFTDYCNEGNNNVTGFFEVILKCTSQINIQSLSFQEEARYIQIEQDKKYHYYGLYSISDATSGGAIEYECYNYFAKYGYTVSGKKEAFEKQINFNGNRFTHDKPYSIQQAVVTKGDKPVWINDFPPEDVLWGIGIANSSSTEIQNTMAAIRSVTDIARQITDMVNSMIVDYAKESGTAGSGNKAFSSNESINRAVIKATISKLIKTQDSLLKAGTWQRWEVSKRDAAKAVNEILNPK